MGEQQRYAPPRFTWHYGAMGTLPPALKCHETDAGCGAGVDMKHLALILVALYLLLTGCIVTYRDFPNATTNSLSTDHITQPIFYHVEPVDQAQKEYGNRWLSALSMIFVPGYYPARSQIDPFGQPGYHAIGRTLTASGMFSDLNEVQGPPKAGFFCKILKFNYLLLILC